MCWEKSACNLVARGLAAAYVSLTRLWAAKEKICGKHRLFTD